MNLLDSGFFFSFKSLFFHLSGPSSESFSSSLLATLNKFLCSSELGLSTYIFAFFEEISHVPVDKDPAIEYKHDSHPLNSRMHLLLPSLDLSKQPVEGTCLVDVGIKDQVVSSFLE